MAMEQAVATPRSRLSAVQSQSLGAPALEPFGRYETDGFYDEMFDDAGQPRTDCQPLFQRIRRISPDDLIRRQRAADRSMVQLGITFNVYGDRQGCERIIPFDIIPRIVCRDEWQMLERGLRQRITALNMLIDDMYHEQRVVRDGVLPEHVVATATGFRPQCVGLTPPRGIWCHITGTDLVRDADGQYYVLEDNLRCPSGVSYVLQNRQLMKQTFPQLFELSAIRPVDDYCSRLLDALQYLMGDQTRSPSVALLSPGMHNSAYFEHSFLAQQMGIDLVEGRDLVVSDGFVYMRTTKGFERIDVLYRRIDDDFLDPQGVPRRFDARRAGADGRLSRRPDRAGQRAGHRHRRRQGRVRLRAADHQVLSGRRCDHSQRADVRVLGRHAAAARAGESRQAGREAGERIGRLRPDDRPAGERRGARQRVRDQIRANPRNFIAQPMLSLSRVPVLTDDGLEGRHVDLRPFIVYGRDVFVLPGGLTRVALKKGSLVVNSSQGGGSKDTWVLS